MTATTATRLTANNTMINEVLKPSSLHPQASRQPSNPVIQRGPGYLSQVIKINIIDYLYGNKETTERDQEILDRYSHDWTVHDGILKVFDGYYYTDRLTTDHVADVMYANEVYTFSALGDLQGTVIPRLIDYGCFFNAGSLEEKLRQSKGHVLDGPFTITENVGSLKVDVTNISHYKAALHSLQLIHSLKVVHGDVRKQNMILQKNGSIMFIDFGHSQVFDSDQDDNFEAYKFQDLLKLKRIFSQA